MAGRLIQVRRQPVEAHRSVCFLHAGTFMEKAEIRFEGLLEREKDWDVPARKEMPPKITSSQNNHLQLVASAKKLPAIGPTTGPPKAAIA